MVHHRIILVQIVQPLWVLGLVSGQVLADMFIVIMAYIIKQTVLSPMPNEFYFTPSRVLRKKDSLKIHSKNN